MLNDCGVDITYSYVMPIYEIVIW